MNLFDKAGISLHPQRLRAIPRIPLLADKVVREARSRTAFAPGPAQLAAARGYAEKLKSAKFLEQKEEAVRPIFIDEILVQVLGYERFSAARRYTLRHEEQAARGFVDTALGTFNAMDGTHQVLAPFELKGPTTRDLDAIMPGRGKSPVQQAWEYANDLPGSRWVLVSNCREIRLYGYGRGREAYEVFDLAKLDQEEEHARLWMVLSARSLLEGGTAKLLSDTDTALKDITNKLYIDYKRLRDQLIAFLTHSADGPKLTSYAAIEPAQKILDRILFVAFAERTDLLPRELLRKAKSARNLFRPEPLWLNFRALFEAVDTGSSALNIDAYNGGLFAPDPRIDAVVIPDPLAGELADLGEWDFGREVPVTVLGHIFEQSITDIERLKAGAGGQVPATSGKRKREGVVYTPEMITRFLVEQTLGKTLAEQLDALKREFGWDEEPKEAQELAVWPRYLEVLRGLTLVDPACGSGAFLIAAYDALYVEYHRTTRRLAELGVAVDFDFVDEIVTKNLHGVDLNAESVEITRLSLWLKTARRDHALQNLEATIKVGNSLIDDAAFTPAPFNWHKAFPQVFAGGGFDLVLGNPPYVRQEFLKSYKPYFDAHYVVAHGVVDLYAYFFERGVKLLKAGGRLGFISSSTFFRTGSGEKLRLFLSDNLSIETIVDFGDLQIFEGVTTYPAVLTLRRAAEPEGLLAYYKVKGAAPEDLGRDFALAAQTMPRARLTAGAWRLEGDALAALRAKITIGRKTLGEVYGPPLYGIKTGLNEAFVIDRATRDRLVAADPKSAELLKPFLRGENVKRWRVESEDLWLVNIVNGFTRSRFAACAKYPDDLTLAWSLFSKAFPAMSAHLALYEEKARVRTDQGQYWWELRACAYMDKFDTKKILMSHFQYKNTFCSDDANFYHNNKSYFLVNKDDYFLALLNSRLFWFVLISTARMKRGNYLEAEAQYVAQLPIPTIPPPQSARLATLAQTCTDAAQARLKIQTAARTSIAALAKGPKTRPSGKLENFWTLDFKTFLSEVKKSFALDLPLKSHAEWQEFLRDTSGQIHALNHDIAVAEAEIDQIVYALFDLTPEEITLLEASLA